MSSNPKYYIIESSALPEVFRRVADAKRLLDTRQAETVNDAAAMTGISRSAFYKYRDAVLSFQNLMAGRIITFQLALHDAMGVLSAILLIFAQHYANILTINQTIPTNGCAMVTITAETAELDIPLEDLLRLLDGTTGVVRAEILAG